MQTNVKVLLLAALPSAMGLSAAGCDMVEEMSGADICADLGAEFEACGYELDVDACLDAPATAEGLLGSSCEELNGYAGSADTPEGALFGEDAGQDIPVIFRVAAFIPCELVDGPDVWGVGFEWFAGDGRGFDSSFESSVRLAWHVALYSDGEVSAIPVVGESHEYSDPTFTGGNDSMGCPAVSNIGSLVTSETASMLSSMSFTEDGYVGFNPRQLDVTAKFHGKLPLTPGMATPDITHNLGVRASWDANGTPTVTFSGEHDPFPAHETYLYTPDGNGAVAIEQFWNPANSPLDLGFGLSNSAVDYSATCTWVGTTWSCS